MQTEERRKWMREYIKQYRLKNKEKYIKGYDDYLRKAKLDAIRIYSNGTMSCLHCGYSNIDALDFDHINNDGAEFRKTRKRANIYLWAKQHNYPPILQILCKNCNWLKEVKRRKEKVTVYT